MVSFIIEGRNLRKIKKVPFKKEKEIQNLVEENLNNIFGLDFLKAEVSLDDLRFDTLAYDNDNKSFVIIEYKNSKNFSVIDQGYAYLSILLNNMAEFVMLFNKLKNLNLDKKDFDWSQTKVMFISPEFTRYQRHAIGFKDLPIELWEISKYENKTIILNQLKQSDARVSIKRIIPTEIKKLKPYKEEDHLKRAPEELVEIYEYIKEQIKSWGDIEIKPLKVYIAFKAPKNFVDIEFPGKKPKSIKIWLNLKKDRLKDPRNLAKDVSKVGHHGNGDYELTITPEDDLKYVVSLIKQSYEFNTNIPSLPSYAGKKFEEMTPEKQKQYQKDRAARFTWEDGDIKVIGYEPLTDEEKKFVEEIKKKRAEEQK